MFNPNDPLLNDKEVAKALALSPSWVRKQRYLRQRGLPHQLTVDPIRVGRSPRYRREDMEKWMEGLDTGENSAVKYVQDAPERLTRAFQPLQNKEIE